MKNAVMMKMKPMSSSPIMLKWCGHCGSSDSTLPIATFELTDVTVRDEIDLTTDSLHPFPFFWWRLNNLIIAPPGGGKEQDQDKMVNQKTIQKVS